MKISPDQIVYWEWGVIRLSATIVYTWGVMAFVTGVSWFVTRKLSIDGRIGRLQNALEVIVGAIREQIREVTHTGPDAHVAFVGTLFLFILVSNVLAVVPGFHPPTGSLSTTASLASLVFLAVPLYGIQSQGLGAYLRQYVEPTWLMLPFNVLGEFSRTLALAVRLYGNMMSGTVIAAILLALAPLFFPIIMHALGLLTGVIQAYIFAVLALVYMASATAAHQTRASAPPPPKTSGD
ncbi:MAG: F0F1 ATP synthase subunit A [Gammaproteobacteria bacterium]|nr:F0F1 ATP synthase subunit A [Gammaproteobacteria bacterium]